jgi:carbon-monoxide dehydrogenase medium subunit
VATGAKGERVIPIEDFFVSVFTTVLQPDEILTEIRIPVPPPRSGGAYFKVERKVSDFATAAVAVQLALDEKGNIQKLGIGLTNVGPTPIKAKSAENSLSGKKPDDNNIAQAAQLAGKDAQPSADLRGPAEYKRGLIQELTKRALVRSLKRAGQ